MNAVDPPPDPEGVSWRELLAETETVVPRHEAQRLIEEASGIAVADFGLELDEPATTRLVARLDAMVARRRAGEPLQYVLGRWGFRTLDLFVDGQVLIPRPETEGVVQHVIDEIRDRNEARVLDLGTGSGAIALSVAAECARAQVTATDVSEDALTRARANLAGLGRAAARVELRAGSWFEALPERQRLSFDVVVSNPPYIADGETLPAEVDDWEPAIALRSGPRGTEMVEHIIREAGSWLVPTGLLVVEMAPHQTEAMVALATQVGFRSEVHTDLSGRPRALVARRS